MLSNDLRMRLLESVSRMASAGRAESEAEDSLKKTFWPVPEHFRAFDPDVVLVVGPRGAGKTELFRAVINFHLLPQLSDKFSTVRLPPMKRTAWRAGFPVESDFPSDRQLSVFFRQEKVSDETMLDIWLAYLVRVLKDELNDVKLAPIYSPPGGGVDSVLQAFRTNEMSALLALDALDQRLVAENRYIFVAYDELDTLARNDAVLTRTAVRGLVALWSTHSRRWKRLRGKIFLRTDLFDRAASAGGADFAKLSANRAELAWSDRHLYAMLVRRLANTSDELLDYCRAAKIQFEDNRELGHFPKIDKAENARLLIERVVGTYMGANHKKGLAFRWVLDHIRDGRGQALPRPLVRMFEIAAGFQKSSGSLPASPKLLEPTTLRRAIDKVSNEHVDFALDEWPWIDGLRKRFLARGEVPRAWKEIERDLDRSFSQNWGSGGARPPADSGRELMEYLVEIGFLRVRSDGRVDAPDLLLAGLNLKRKGGVKRR